MKPFLFPLFLAASLWLTPDLFARADLAPARALIDKKDFAAAAEALEKIVAVEPDHLEAWLNLGDTLLSRVNKVGLLSKADMAKRGAAAFRKAAELDPKNVRARVSLIGYYAQAPFFVGGNRDKARAGARELVALDAFNGNLWLMRLALDDDRSAEALAACEAMLRAEPDSYRALCAHGQACAVTGQQLDPGAASLCRALSMAPEKNPSTRAAAFEWLGQILEKKGDAAGAVAAYESALQLAPQRAGVRERLAKLK